MSGRADIRMDPPTVSVAALRDLQLERLREVLRRACDRVPHYRREFERAGVQPTDLRCLADLARFPFLTKAAFRDEYPFGLLAVPRSELARVHASSGTTGRPTIVGYTAKDLETWAIAVARCLHLAGVRPGDAVHVAYGYGLFTGGLGAHYGVERLGCTVLPVSGGQTERQVQLILDLEPRVLMCTPSYLLTILDEFDRRGVDPRTTSLRIAILGAEPWSEATRAAIERRSGLVALDVYGLSEVMGPGVAQETPDARGELVLWEDLFYPEIVDPDTGRVLPDGEEGELVLTALSKEAMPIVRYRTRDLTRLRAPREGCMRTIARVHARSDDMLILRGVNVFPGQIEELVSSAAGLAPHHRLELVSRGTRDEMIVHVERLPGASDAGMADALAARIKDRVGITVGVVLHEPNVLERSEGKARRVVDRRQR